MFILLHIGIPFVLCVWYFWRAPYLQELPADNYLQGAVWPISTFHVGPDQPDLRRNPNHITPTPTLWAIAPLRRVFWGRFSKKAWASETSVSTNQTRSVLQEVICR